jgi:hypothetical protein
MGIGRFLAGAQLAREENRDIDIVLTTHFPSLRTVPGETPQSPKIFSQGGCLVRIFLDDWPLADNDLSFVRTWDLAAIEYYTGGSAPAQYRTGRATCGVLLLWSKR